ncbi:MAG: hypothetical protein CL878_07200 [Dehalococcoidia bacterium]|nr:hypothetical protein [Dehalococcoidia bacterium]
MWWVWRFLTPHRRVGRLGYLLNLLITFAIWSATIFLLFGVIITEDVLRDITSGDIAVDAIADSILYSFAGIGIVNYYLLFAQVAKRLHDIDRSAWWYCLNLIPIVGQLLFFIMVVSLLNVPGKEYVRLEEEYLRELRR